MTSLRHVVLAVALATAVVPATAQQQRETERRLERVKRELESVAAERRKLEGQRGTAARQLRAADERVAAATRALRETEAGLEREELALAELGARRGELQQRLGAQREELAGLLRAAYGLGDHAALKLLLAQDRVGDANRTLAYHRYLQRQRAERIGTLRDELAELDAVEREIDERTAALAEARQRQREQLGELERERGERAATVAQLERRHDDRREREQALGRDAKGLERVLAQLREAAARAAAAERAAAARARREGDDTRRAPAQVARGAPIRVGGLGWPLSGNLLAGFGGRMPDGRTSSGVLIGAPSGTTVQAVADGTVVFAEWMTGYGLIVIVDHGNGHMSLYAHNDALLRDVGDRVGRGDAVASVGNSGGQGQPALYFELRRDGKPIDPATWLQKR
ncbi:murein hydrolase activator EnvC family protein [Luteimonas sp. R10]|uniref:murein hydrolase activator EnvC family protein n=1 Tax=Luteimonas sp. R10 TaxID=3108176 RepID=UPI0030881FC7|nr:peptidoglycan DD-metalloendopeptidase family protein [Luteimonas sp. R10]